MTRGVERKTTRTSQTGILPVLVSCVLLVLSASALQSQSVPGTVIRNLATVTYQASTGASFAPVSDSAFVTVGSPSGIAVLLAKNVDRATGTLGDILTYTITYQALGAAVATNVVISDLVPAGATYVPASMTLDGTVLSDVTGDDAGAFDALAGRVAITIPAVTGGATGTIAFRASLDGTASPTNIARADYITPLGADSAQSNAVQTTLLFANVSVTKLLDSPVGPAIARVGDAVSYRIRYSTAAGVIARNVIVTDTLPAGLQYVSAIPAATVSGSVLTWGLGDVPAGTTADITVQTTVPATLPDSVTVINTASLASDNAPGAAAAAPPVLLLLAGSGQLALVKTADVLEVSLGETVPYTLTLQNTGAIALSDLRVSDHLPEGGRYSVGSALGADSVTANGRDLTFYVAGPLAAGATQTVRYRVAVVSADGDVLENRAVATAEAGSIQTTEARAWVRIRHSWPLETRAAIGRVFVDENRNGRQDSGEPGIGGVDVWTDDGEITTTDSDGRFSFQNLRPGRHAYHIDAVTLPSAYDAAATPIVMRDGSGWTTPRVNFAVVPRTGESATPAGAVRSAQSAATPGGEAAPVAGVPSAFASAPTAGVPSAVASAPAAGATSTSRDTESAQPQQLAVSAQPPTRAACEFDDVVPGSHGDRAIIAHFQKNDTRPYYVLDVEEIGRRVAAQLRDRPDCGVQIIGYTDTNDVYGGPFWSNQRLSEERARWVAYQLRFTPMKPTVVDVFGRGESDQLFGFGDDLLRRSRRVELRFVSRGNAPLAGTSQPVIPAEHRGPSADVVPDAGLSSRSVPLSSSPPSGAAVPERVNAVTVPTLRSASDRAAEAQRALTSGPAVTVFAPADGAVLASDRVFVGVRGEPGAKVELFDGAKLIAPAQMRGDGVSDFIAVPLTRGPHRLRVRMMNSWGQERWDSLDVHVSGRPARFASEHSPVVLVAGGQPTDTLHVRALDQWNVPVVGGAFVTVSANGAKIVSADQDGSSVGVQVKADSSGWLTIELSGGRDVRMGSLALRSGAAASQVPLQVLPAMRPLMMTAVGRIGVGASPDAFGAATARGRLDDRTSVTVSVDSRQLDAGREEFGRAVDPLSEAQYPILGDASSAHTSSASRYAVAARLERGMDWLAFGDLSTGAFASGLALSGYDRALSGVAGHVTTGDVVWQGFGSTSTERLAQIQIRGRGMSGPYDIGVQLRPGTERVVIETRALENAQRYLARQEMERYVDYQIDYDNGLLLFKQPVPATDLSGNPVFIVVTYGADDGGAPSTVWGLRASADARGLRTRYQLDSVRIGSTFIRDGRPGADRELAGLDFGILRTGWGSLRAELARSSTPDSVGLATSIDGSLTLAKGLVSLSAGWLHADPEFHNPANVALTGGAADLRFGARFATADGGTEFRLDHSAQRFDVQNMSRSRSIASVSQKLGDAWRAEARLASDHFDAGTTPADASQASELKLTWTPLSALSVWAEGRHHLGGADTVSTVQPDYVGGGARFRLSPGASLELNHRQVLIPNGDGYSVTTIGGRSELWLGGEAWGSYEIAGAGAAHGAALVGLSNRLRLSPAWTLNAMFERRVGLSRAPAADPLRALPFLQAEEDYWSAALGSEWLPVGAPYRASLRGELRDGAERSSRLVTLAGEASLSPAFAVLTRQEAIAEDDRQPTGMIAHRRFSSLTGLAFRPVGSDALNFLGKVEVIDATNPLGGGVLTMQTGHESRRILTAEAIWAPQTAVELATRYAVRYTDATVTHTDGVVQPLSSSAEYAGASLDIRMSPWWGLRGEGRLLHEGTSATTRWDAAPQLVLMPLRGVEVAVGYRAGDLHDPDFAVRGGSGWFMTLGAAVTEQSIHSLAAYWRDRWSR